MNKKKSIVETTLRIPGAWAGFDEIVSRIPKGFSICDDGMVMPDGQVIEIFPMKPDKDFPGVFESACRKPATAEELSTLKRYTVNLGLIGPGGSLEAAKTMLQAGAAIIQTGGAGVFIDNSMVAHGASLWNEMAAMNDIEAISFAFVGIIRRKTDLHTMGMNVLGKPDIVMSRSDFDENNDSMIEMIRYVCSSKKVIGDGHIIANEFGPQFQTKLIETDDAPVGSYLHNPSGRIQLINAKTIRDRN